MKNTRLITTMLVTVFVGSSLVFGQNRQDGNRDYKQKACNRLSSLDESQQALVKDVHQKYGEELKQMRLELAEMKAHQKTLFGNSNPSESKLLANAQEMVEMKAEMSKKTLALRLEMKSIVNPDDAMMLGRRGFQKNDDNMKGRKGSMRAKHTRNGKQRGAGECFEAGRGRRYLGQNEYAGKGNARMQNGKGEMRGNRNKYAEGKRLSTFFTEDQKAAMLDIKKSNYQQITDLTNKLNELQVHQKTILAQKDVDIDAANDNIDAMTKLKSDLAVIHVKSRLEIHSLLSEEQKAKMGSRMLHKRGNFKNKDRRG